MIAFADAAVGVGGGVGVGAVVAVAVAGTVAGAVVATGAVAAVGELWLGADPHAAASAHTTRRTAYRRTLTTSRA